MKRNNSIIILFILLILPIVIYVLNFGKNGLSEASGDWSNFATYCSISIGLANLFIFYWLTKEIHIYNVKRDEEIVKPIISFFRREEDKFYTVENIGTRAAIDVWIKKNIQDKKWSLAKQYYTLPPGEKIKLGWTYSSQELAASYKDINGNVHFSYMDDNRLRYFDEHSGKLKFTTEFKKVNYPIKVIEEVPSV